MFDKQNKVRATSLRSRKVLKWGLLVMHLAFGSMTVVAGIQSLPAQTKFSNDANRCQAMAKLNLVGVEITGAKLVPPAPAGTVPYNQYTKNTIPALLPEHCRVEGMINRRKGADGMEYAIGFGLALPSNWNGRLMFQGGGAFNGSVGEPYGLNAAGDEPALTRGFAVISTDSGHKGKPFDTTFMHDQQASLDFAFNAVPIVTRLGKDLTAKYFGRAPHHSYSSGCSTGGREGMLAAQRYPDLFDGIISGDPAMRSAHTRIAVWNAMVAFNRIAPKDADGKPLPLQAFPAEDQKLLAAAVAKQCDELDGLRDGLILNLAACKFDPAILECEKGKNAGCLSTEQVMALKTAFGGPRDGRGKPIYTGFPYDLGLLGEHVGNRMSLLPTSAQTPYAPPPSPFSLDFESDVERIRADALQTLTDTDEWTDLGSYYRKGGKILFYHGASDPWYSMIDTLDYVQRNEAVNPEANSSRFYSVPGMAHCSDGGLEQFDMLTTLVDWVENGKSPGAIVATDWTRKAGTRPLCPWPQYGRYKGSGNSKDAANFECRSD
jgi:pimeloyl-ACP methyl ester carboxylesterase